MSTDINLDEGLVLDLSGIEEAAPREALRAGTYPCELVDLELTESKKGSPMLKWTYQTTDDDLDGRRFWNYTLLDNEVGQRITRDHIQRLNPEFDFSEQFNVADLPEQLVGRPCRVTVDRGNYQGRPTNNVKNVLAPSGDSGEFLS